MNRCETCSLPIADPAQKLCLRCTKVLAGQYVDALRNGAAVSIELSPADVLALASRESRVRQVRG